ncbi:MAG: hypothetical protein AB7O24_23675 [Kofleriaceae bacterium]
MKKPLPSWTYTALVLCGVVLIGSMFMTWIDVMGHTETGFAFAWRETKWLLLVPLVGVVLAATAATRAEATRLAAICAGLLIAGYLLFSFARTVVIDGGLDTWMIFGGAGLSIVGGASSRHTLRLVGGIAVLAGFFAPWDDQAMWRDMLEVPAEIAGMFGLKILWLIPVGGLLSIAGALSSRRTPNLLAILGGVVVLGSISWWLLQALDVVFAFGAWSALGASTIALVLGMLVPRSSSRPASIA